jgi:hypothetical protein
MIINFISKSIDIYTEFIGHQMINSFHSNIYIKLEDNYQKVIIYQNFLVNGFG